MDFLKKNYEKVLLGVVLVALAVGAAFLPWMISKEREAEQKRTTGYFDKRVEELPPPTEILSRAEQALQRIAKPLTLDFSTSHKLFNPVAWQKRPDGTLAKVALGNEVGVEAVVVSKITPLYTIITLDSVTPATADTEAKYVVGVEREAKGERKKSYYSSLNSKNDTFVIREVKGPPDAPELVVEMNDTNERAVVSKAQPFKRADGYKADLKYPPENRTWLDLRVGAGGPRTPPILIGGESYIVVAISKNEVVLSAKSGKKTTRPYSPGS